MTSNELHHYYGFAQKHGGFARRLPEEWERILQSGHNPDEDWNAGLDGSPYKYRRRSSPLFCAVLDGDMRLIDVLLRHGAALENHNADGHTALHEAIIESHHSVVLRLLDQGASVSTPIKSDFLSDGAALHLAVVKGDVEVANTLIARGADPIAKTAVGWTPIDIAILGRQTTMLLALSKSIGLTVEAYATRSEQGAHPLGHHTDTASHILEHGTRNTDRKHCDFYHSCLTGMLSTVRSVVGGEAARWDCLINEVEKSLLNHAKVSGAVSWPRNLCKSCESFERQDATQVFGIFKHSPDHEALVQSAAHGCNLCQYFAQILKDHWCLLHQIEKKWMKSWGVSPEVRISVEREGHRLIVACGDKICFTDLKHVPKYISDAVAQTSPSDTRGSGSDRSLAIAKAWLSQCENEHQLCRGETQGRLPTRVIRVGSELEEPCIYKSEGERIPYSTLSYCWGRTQNIRLLSSCMKDYYRRLPSEDLPPTIADAITTTRKMGIQYLWVDALCILQDSDEDLHHELANMGDIYAYSCFTIAARDSESCADGCFRSRDWPTSAIVPLNLQLPENATGKANMRTSPYNRLMALPRHRVPDQGHRRDQKPNLETRGWALQENVLSRRVLQCGENELSWTCVECQCSERYPEATAPMSFGSHWLNRTRHALATGKAGDGIGTEHDSDDLFELWTDMIKDFLHRQLSDGRDKLVAISGVQGALGKILQDTPVVGIWRGKFFAASLLWKALDRSDLPPVGAIDSPSWSWVSVPRIVEYARLPSRKRSVAAWYEEFEYLIEAVAWDVDESRPRLGITGFAEVRCRLLRERDIQCERHVVDDFLNRPPKSQTGAEAIHYETHHDSGDPDTTPDAWLMPVRTDRFIPDIKGRNWGYVYDIRTYLLRLEKISQDPEDMSFRRVGLVISRSWENKWLKDAKSETIRLF